MIGFYRVERFDSPAQARTVTDAWAGMVIVPLVDPHSAGGKWLKSGQGRRELDFVSGDSVLVIYPEADGAKDYLELLEGLCEAFQEHDVAIRAIYPEPAVLILDLTECRGVICRLKNLSMANSCDKDLVRRSLMSVIRTATSEGLAYFLLATECRMMETVYRFTDAAPVMATMARKLALPKFSTLLNGALKTIVESLKGTPRQDR